MESTLSGRVVVITGASSGIGRATALELAREQAALVLCARSERALAEVREECERRGAQVLARAVDVSLPRPVDDLAETAVARFGRIDAWVNNAAVHLFARIDEAPYADYRRVLETNLFGYVHGARCAIRQFREQGQGTLVNVSSMNGKAGAQYASAYVASKFAIVGLGESLRQELRDLPDVHVCTVLPASIDTPLFQHAGNFTGRAVKPMNPVYSADRAARAIISCLERPRREVLVGGAAWALRIGHALSPALAEAVMARHVERDHFEDRPAPATAGNLHAPLEESNQVSGGWKNGGVPAARAAGALAGVAAVAALAAAGAKRMH